MALFKGLTSKTAIISDYKPFYIQKTLSGVATCYDSRVQFGMVARSNPYPALPTPKDPYKNEWLDANGDDEYTETLYYSAYEFEVSFYAKALSSGGSSAAEVLRGWLNSFFTFVKDGDLEIYDSYTAIGRRKVRYAGFAEDSFVSRKDWASTTFTITFKVNDPVTLMKYSGGTIINA